MALIMIIFGRAKIKRAAGCRSQRPPKGHVADVALLKHRGKGLVIQSFHNMLSILRAAARFKKTRLAAISVMTQS